MPYLEITPELVGPRRSRIVLDMIQAEMLWPHDEIRKSRAGEASRAQHSVDMVDSVIDFSQPIDPGDFKMLAQTFLDAPRFRDIHEDAKRPFIHGMTAGFILYQMISLSEVGSPVAQLTTVKKRILADLGSKVPQRFRFSLSTIDNTIWPRYRVVANLWAAHIAQANRDHDTAFPCRLELVLEFLAYSEYFRLKGEKLRPKQSPSGTVLKSEVALAVPREISLPSVNISWLRNKPN